jgi:hypothetical protein
MLKFRLRRAKNLARTSHFASQNIPDTARVYGPFDKSWLQHQTPSATTADAT